MKIVDIRVHLLSAPIPEPYRWRSTLGCSVKRDTVVLEVITDEGIVGYGESGHALAPTVVAEIIESTLKPELLGEDPTQVQALWKKMAVATRMQGNSGLPVQAMAGVEIALWDIVGKVAGLPIHRLFGGAAKTVPAYAGGLALGYKSPEARAEEAARLVAEHGFTALKLRVGQGVRKDTATVKAVREAVGPDVEIMVDVNGAYSRRTAYEMAHVYQEYGVFWMEEPLPYADLEGYARLAADVEINIAGGENCYLRTGFKELLDRRAVDVIQPDCNKTGFMEAKLAADMFGAFSMPCAPHVLGTAIDTAISLHLLACIPNGLKLEFDMLPNNALSDGLLAEPFRCVEGRVKVPQGPGLGIEIDPEAFARYPFIDGPSYVMEN